MRYLILLESPNKILTVKNILKGTQYEKAVVMASKGHITEIKDDKNSYCNTGIYPNKDFKINYVIKKGKIKDVELLKEQVKFADKVFLMTDGDREGEVIADHLRRFLKIPKEKCFRVITHEITKEAVLKALNNPISINNDLVNAGECRSALDKIIGYPLSVWARNNVGAKSVGRCQSAGLKLIVERDEEIKNFVPQKYYDLILHFSKNKTEFKAKHSNEKGEVLTLDTLEECNNVIKDCINPFSIYKIERKNQLENPQPPFTTSTFQQEVSKKLGIGVKEAMNYAQSLFEGINIGGEHIALTTYLRTDDANIAPDFLPILEKYVKDNFGDSYFAPVKKFKTGDNSQEGHECFRVVDLEMTPNKLSQYVKDEILLKIYTIIYNRTLAASMKPATYATTKYIIINNNHYFTMNSKELIFEGFKKVYNYSKDENEVVKESFNEKEILQNTNLEPVEKQTNPPKRYDEASLIKELDKRGIGRPSTYQTIIETLEKKDRGYCEVNKKELIPTELGIKLSHALDKNFNSFISLDYTKEMEEDLDKIAKGEMNKLDFLKDFYSLLEKSLKDSSSSPECPLCGSPMVLRYSYITKNNFWGCSKYPNCKGIKNK